MLFSPMKKFLTAFVVVVFSAVSLSPVHSVPVEDEQWPSQFKSTESFHGFELNEVSGLRDNVSVLIGSDSTGQKICSSVTDAACSSTAGYSFRAVLGPCTSTVTIDCIESVTGTSSGGTAVAGVFKEFFPARGVNDYTGSTADGVPDGRPPSLWTLAGLPHAYGTEYQVTVQVTGAKINGDATKPLRSFFASVTPVNIFQTECNVLSNGTCMDKYREEVRSGLQVIGFAGVAADQDKGFRCQNWGEDSKCALKRAFPAGSKFAVQVRLSTTPTGWLHGRLQDPTASIERVNNQTTIKISAEPTKVPAVSGVGQWAQLPTAVQESFIATCENKRCGTRRSEQASDSAVQGMPVSSRNIIFSPAAYSEEAFKQLKLWTGFIGDKAAAMPSQWSVRTLSYSEMQNGPACIRNGVGVTGIVATNASAYAEGPPTYSSATSTLNYKVAAPHYEKDGTTVFNGRYDLILRSDIANCLYGVSDGASEATVSVTGEDGKAKSATTAFTFKDGWFKFSASGFTHSAPTVKVKLSKIYPKVTMGRSISVTAAAKKNGVKIPTGAKVLVTVASSSKKKCSVSGNRTVRGLAKGTCTLSVSVTPKKTKAVPKPKTTRSTVKIIIK
jgi:hypothetical protein